MHPSVRRISPRLRRPGAFPFRAVAAACLYLICPAAIARAQTFDATNLSEPADLAATWLVHAGDDPAYATAGFDDSQWTRFDSRTDLHSIFPHNHPEVVWYRLHVKAAPAQAGLALEEHQISSAFEVYVNGERIMQSGQIAPFEPYTVGARLLAPISNRQDAKGSFVIALRVHISRTDWGYPRPGFAAENLTLGKEHELRDHVWLTVIGYGALHWLNQLFGLGLGIVALALFAAQRRHREYLWIFLQYFCLACSSVLTTIEYFHNLSANWEALSALLILAGRTLGVPIFFAFLRLRFGRSIRIACAVALAGGVFAVFGGSHESVAPIAVGLALFPYLFLLSGVLPVLLVVHLRRGNREAGILLIPAILQSLTNYVVLLLFFLARIPALFAMSLRWASLLYDSHAGPFVLDINELCALLYTLSLAIIIVLRSTHISRQQALLEGEVAAAREVQQVILPEQVEAVPGYSIESEYHPAQQVGGDFFQVMPAGKGELMIVVGDVAGKGLPAAMLVSVLVGSIRTAIEDTHAPEVMLRKLNDRLVGRANGGFSTALAAHITADGRVTIANAGHLSPYLDGREIELPGALPLGVVSGATYETSEFHLAPGSRLTFYSDGVVEAQTPRGELFGFDRARDISTQSAAVIAEAARQFGQQDDITVVAITRHALIATAA